MPNISFIAYKLIISIRNLAPVGRFSSAMPHIFTFSRVYLCLPQFTRACLHIITHVYSCVPMFTLVYLCLLLFTRVYLCLHLFTAVYLCLPMFTHVELITCVYLCFPVRVSTVHFWGILFIDSKWLYDHTNCVLTLVQKKLFTEYEPPKLPFFAHAMLLPVGGCGKTWCHKWQMYR